MLLRPQPDYTGCDLSAAKEYSARPPQVVVPINMAFRSRAASLFILLRRMPSNLLRGSFIGVSYRGIGHLQYPSLSAAQGNDAEADRRPLPNPRTV